MNLHVLAVFTVLALAPGSQVAAQASPGPASLTDLELGRLRGGFLTAGEVRFEFGAEVRTFAEGALALRTNVTWTATGAKIEQQGAGAVRPGADIAGADGAFRTGDGAAIVHQVTEGRLASFLVNTGSNRSYRQETDITLTLPGFAAMQGAISQQALGARLSADIAAASLRAGR